MSNLNGTTLLRVIYGQWGEGSMANVLPVQTLGPESLESRKTGTAQHIYNPSAPSLGCRLTSEPAGWPGTCSCEEQKRDPVSSKVKGENQP